MMITEASHSLHGWAIYLLKMQHRLSFDMYVMDNINGYQAMDIHCSASLSGLEGGPLMQV